MKINMLKSRRSRQTLIIITQGWVGCAVRHDRRRSIRCPRRPHSRGYARTARSSRKISLASGSFAR